MKLFPYFVTMLSALVSASAWAADTTTPQEWPLYKNWAFNLEPGGNLIFGASDIILATNKRQQCVTFVSPCPDSKAAGQPKVFNVGNLKTPQGTPSSAIWQVKFTYEGNTVTKDGVAENWTVEATGTKGAKQFLLGIPPIGWRAGWKTPDPIENTPEIQTYFSPQLVELSIVQRNTPEAPIVPGCWIVSSGCKK